MKKYLVCVAFSLLLAALLPFMAVDMHEPTNSTAVSGPNQETVLVDGTSHVIHTSKPVGLAEQLAVYFSSTEMFMYYLKMVLTWFVPMLVATAVTTWVNTRAVDR